MVELPIDKRKTIQIIYQQLQEIFTFNQKNSTNVPTRSLGVFSLFVESDLEKLRFEAVGWIVSLGVVWKVSFGVVVGVVELWGSGNLRPSEFHLRCLLSGSLFPTAA
jgi:hypothetical protein